MSICHRLAERFVLTKMIRVNNKDELWFNDDCWCAFGGHVIALEVTVMSFSITKGGELM